jgi:hypothetical protein
VNLLPTTIGIVLQSSDSSFRQRLGHVSSKDPPKDPYRMPSASYQYTITLKGMKDKSLYL